MSEREDRVLGPEMVADGWIVIGGDDIMWMHPPSQRCVVINETKRGWTRGVPCWGPEPSDPSEYGYLVACRVHDDGGEPLYGDAFWVESYTIALRVARQIREMILAETPSQKRMGKEEFERRKGEAWAEIRRLCENNARILAEREEPKP